MLPVSLCHRNTVESPHSSAVSSDMDKPWLYANHCRLEIFAQREKNLLSGFTNSSTPTKVDQFLQGFETRKPLLANLQQTRFLLLERFSKTAPAVLIPLEDCILSILWGFLECESAQKAIQPWMTLHNGTLEDFIILLNSAAVYQASIGSVSSYIHIISTSIQSDVNLQNQLIAYSLTCLHACIEALHVNALGGLEGSHEACELSICKVNCIRNIELQIEQYLDELTRVIFLKENMRSRIWWLSAFYSLCIQGVIRQALILLSFNDQKNVPTTDKLSAEQYLHIATRLFIVSSGNHDPLIQDWSSKFASPSLEDEAPSTEDFQNAQLAIKQPDWKLKGIKKSGNYLKKLFEDNGGPLAEPEDDGPANMTILPEPYLPKMFTLETCRQLRADWDLARCNYTKNIVQIATYYGRESKAYTDAEEKWALVEAEWKMFSDDAVTNTVNNAHAGCNIESLIGET